MDARITGTPETACRMPGAAANRRRLIVLCRCSLWCDDGILEVIMILRAAGFAAALCWLALPSGGDDCVKAPKGEFLGEVKPVLYVADLPRSVAFFRDALGFEFLNYSGEEGDPYYAEMAAGPTKFGLHRPRNERERARVGRQRLYFRVRDVEAQSRHVAACDGKPDPIIKRAWMTMFSVTDPDGHEITFAETDPKVHTIDPW